MKKIFATSVFAMAALSANAAPLVTIGDQLDIFFRGAVTGSWNSNVTYTGSSNKINDYAAIFRLGAEADYGRNSKFKANVKFFEDLTRYAQHKEFNSNLSHVMATASFTDQLLKIDANFSFDQRFQNTTTTIQNDALVRYDDYAAGINATYSFSEKLDGELGGMWQYTEYLGKWSAIYSDVDVYSIPVSLLYKLNPKISVGLTYQYRYTEFSGGDPLNAIFGGDSRNDHFGGVTVRGELLPKLTAMVYAGVTYRDPSVLFLLKAKMTRHSRLGLPSDTNSLQSSVSLPLAIVTSETVLPASLQSTPAAKLALTTTSPNLSVRRQASRM